MFMRLKHEYKRRWGDLVRKLGAQKVGRFGLVGAIWFSLVYNALSTHPSFTLKPPKPVLYYSQRPKP